jgi:hypothetical protein
VLRRHQIVFGPSAAYEGQAITLAPFF